MLFLHILFQSFHTNLSNKITNSKIFKCSVTEYHSKGESYQEAENHAYSTKRKVVHPMVGALKTAAY